MSSPHAHLTQRQRAVRAGLASGKSTKPRRIDPTTCERQYSPEELEFMHAYEAYKNRTGRRFPTLSETLQVLKGLGYTKAAPAAG